MQVTVREMRPDEWSVAQEVCVGAFDETGIDVLLTTLRSSWGWDDSLAFVAVNDQQVVGLVLFTPCFVDAPDRVVPVLVLSPLGVRRDVQGHGVGSQLVRGALAELERTRTEPAVFLEGSPGYYPRFGFRPASTMGFTAPSTRIPDAACMVYPLPSYDSTVRGALVYADAFWRADAVGLRE
jgi:putative acetyltransferase